MLIHNSRDVGAAIRATRKAKGVNQIELAARIGKHQSLVSRVENGGDAEFPTLISIFDVLGLKFQIAGIPEAAAGDLGLGVEEVDGSNALSSTAAHV
jgi:transcriptional regulator with XRE-family HTH domain